MKTLFHIVIILTLGSCKNITKNPHAKTGVNTDTLASSVIPDYKTDTLTKTSKPFTLNKLSCYWNHFFVINNYGDSTTYLEIKMTLKDYKTKKTLLAYEIIPRYLPDYNYKSQAYFDTVNVRYFIDVNFDGFKDFKIYDDGSTPMASMTNIYIFNNKTKSFNYSEELSDNTLEELDTINKTLTTFSWGLNTQYSKKHYFAKNGKIKFTEVIAEENYYPDDTTSMLIKTYKKMVNGIAIEIKIDTLSN